MPHHISIRRKVEFSDTDMAGIVHFSNYFRYVELAEAALFEQADYPLIVRSGNRAEGWPRVRASCDFREPLHFGDEVEVRLKVNELKIKAIEYKFRIYRIVPDTEPLLAAKGKMTTIFARIFGEGQMESAPLPQELIDKIKPPDSGISG